MLARDWDAAEALAAETREVSARYGIPDYISFGDLLAGTAIAGHIPRAATGFQVKAQKMPRQAILEEMAPSGVVLGSIGDLAANAGAYVIVSSKESRSDRGRSPGNGSGAPRAGSGQ